MAVREPAARADVFSANCRGRHEVAAVVVVHCRAVPTDGTTQESDEERLNESDPLPAL
jgi:hypothetical protein